MAMPQAASEPPLEQAMVQGVGLSLQLLLGACKKCLITSLSYNTVLMQNVQLESHISLNVFPLFPVCFYRQEIMLIKGFKCIVCVVNIILKITFFPRILRELQNVSFKGDIEQKIITPHESETLCLFLTGEGKRSDILFIDDNVCQSPSKS